MLHEIGAFTYNGGSGADMTLLVGSLIHSLGALVALDMRGPRHLVLKDTAGRVRSLAARPDDPRWDFKDIWRVLSARYWASASMQTIQINLSYWNELAAALTD